MCRDRGAQRSRWRAHARDFRAAAVAASRGRGKSVSQKSDPQRYWLRSAAGGDELCARTPVWASLKAAQTAPLPPVTSPSAPVGSGRAARADRRSVVGRVVDTRQSVMAVSVSVVFVLFKGSADTVVAAATAAAVDENNTLPIC